MKISRRVTVRQKRASSGPAETQIFVTRDLTHKTHCHFEKKVRWQRRDPKQDIREDDYLGDSRGNATRIQSSTMADDGREEDYQGPRNLETVGKHQNRHIQRPEIHEVRHQAPEQRHSQSDPISDSTQKLSSLSSSTRAKTYTERPNHGGL